MSGEAYSYRLQKVIDARFDDDAKRIIDDALDLLHAIGRELSWGASCDTCLKCADLRAVAALHEWLREGGAITGAVAVVRDAKQHKCADCTVRDLRAGAR